MTARTKQEILEELENNSPRWATQYSMYVSMLRAGARALSFVETAVEELLPQAFRQTAGGEFLDDIGGEVGVSRLPGEADEIYRQRIRLRGRGVTLPGLQAELDLVVEHYAGAGYDVRLFEPRAVSSDGAAFTDDPQTITPNGEVQYLFWVDLPVFAADRRGSPAYADLGFSDIDAAADSVRESGTRLVYQLIVEWMDELRAGGVAFGVTVQDRLTTNMFFTYDLTPTGAGNILQGV